MSWQEFTLNVGYLGAIYFVIWVIKKGIYRFLDILEKRMYIEMKVWEPHRGCVDLPSQQLKGSQSKVFGALVLDECVGPEPARGECNGQGKGRKESEYVEDESDTSSASCRVEMGAVSQQDTAPGDVGQLEANKINEVSGDGLPGA